MRFDSTVFWPIEKWIGYRTARNQEGRCPIKVLGSQRRSVVWNHREFLSGQTAMHALDAAALCEACVGSSAFELGHGAYPGPSRPEGQVDASAQAAPWRQNSDAAGGDRRQQPVQVAKGPDDLS